MTQTDYPSGRTRFVPKTKHHTPSLEAIARAAIVRPLTCLYVAAVVCVMLAVEGRFGVIYIIASLTLFALAVLVVAVASQMKFMYTLLEGSQERLIARVTQLTKALEEAGVEVPKDMRLASTRSTIRRG
jgi:hypothetical protein